MTNKLTVFQLKPVWTDKIITISEEGLTEYLYDSRSNIHAWASDDIPHSKETAKAVSRIFFPRRNTTQPTLLMLKDVVTIYYKWFPIEELGDDRVHHYRIADILKIKTLEWNWNE